MERKGYYSPPLRRDLVSRLYHTAREMRVPMTVLNDRLVEDALKSRLASPSHSACLISLHIGAKSTTTLRPEGRLGMVSSQARTGCPGEQEACHKQAVLPSPDSALNLLPIYC